MSLVLLASGWALLVVPAVLVRLARGSDPERIARTMFTALLAGAAAVELGLLTMSLPTILRTVGVTGLARTCERMFHGLASTGPGAAWASAALLALSLVAAVRGLVRARRIADDGRIEAWIGNHRSGEAWEVVVVPTDVPIAYSALGRPVQVVLSEGLVRRLTPEEVDRVVAHEACHLRHRHQRWLLGLTVVERGLRALPGVVWSVAALRFMIERWADEEAAGPSPIARATLRRALLSTATAAVAAELAAFGSVRGLVDRAAALEGPPAEPSLTPRVLGGVLVAASGSVGAWAFAVWVGTVHAALAMAHYCPT